MRAGSMLMMTAVGCGDKDDDAASPGSAPDTSTVAFVEVSSLGSSFFEPSTAHCLYMVYT
ncbi:MAG: hypothetical protein ACI8RZ_000111 [Myxococcota bacterium]|jgi:hypothetical protein